MKNENLIRAIGALDEDLIVRAEKHNIEIVESKIHKQRFSQRPKRLIACIAAIVALIGIVSVCAATGILDRFFKHFGGGGEIDTYRDDILSTIASVSNDNLEISIEGAVMDNRQCLIVFSTTAISDAGKELVNEAKRLDGLELTAILKDGSIVRSLYWTYTFHKGSLTFSNGKASYVLEIRPTDIEMSSIETLNLSFEGLSLELSMQHYVTDILTLHSDDADALDVVEMSPIGIYLKVPVVDTDPAAIRQQQGNIEMRPILADGSLAEDYFINGTFIYNEAQQMIYVYENFVVVDEETLKITITDVSKYSGLQVSGINYYKMGNQNNMNNLPRRTSEKEKTCGGGILHSSC